jgi:hypothetical protein
MKRSPRVPHVCSSTKGDIIGKLKRLSAQAGEISTSHAEAVVTRQCFDGDRRSLPEPEADINMILSDKQIDLVSI